MRNEHSWLQNVRFYARVSAVYLLTIGFAWYVSQPLSLFNHSQTVALTKIAQQPHVPIASRVTLVAGRPVRIVIPSENIDLPVDSGYYNSSDGSWTLSGYRAQFAMTSTLANNTGGNTFIYGHNNNSVFGPLRHVTPSTGAAALLYTDNGHILAYSFQSVKSVAPDDVSALRYNGPSVLTIQTCTGSVNEWRTMFRFSFDKVVQ